MATNGDSCVVNVVIDPNGCAITFKSKEMRAALEATAAQLVRQKTELALPYLKGPMPNNGLYGYRIKKGSKTLYAVIHPVSPPGYFIGRKHGTL